MDGLYQNKHSELSKTLKDWVEHVIEGELWNKFEDLHIDEVNKEFKSKEKWIDASIFSFQILKKLVNKDRYNVLLAIPLKCSNSKNVKLDSVKSVKENLDITPPSFYVYPNDMKNFINTINQSNFLNKLSSELNFECYVKTDIENHEYYSTVFIR